MEKNKMDRGDILIVDDQPNNLKILTSILEQHGYKVRPALSGELALKAVRNSLPDIILLDILMPGMDGFEVCKQLKADEKTGRIPVIFVSALEDITHKMKAFAVGGVDYISKPFHEEEVLARTETHLKLRRMELSLFENNRRLQKEISERKEMERSLRESEKKFKGLFDSSLHAIALTDMQTGKIVDVNDKLCRVSKYSRDELIGNTTTGLGFYSEDDRNKFLNEFTNSGKVHGLEMDFILKNGSTLNTRMFATSIEIKGDAFVLTEFHDITDQKKFEAQFQQAQKMEAIATLAGGVAHEFNNALMGIMGNIELLKMELPEDERRNKSFDAMNISGHRMSNLTDQLLAYAEGGKYQPKNLKLDDLVIETLPILQHVHKSDIRVETHFQKGISYISADNAQLQMVLSAILANSNEAMEDGALIKITAENKDVDDDFIEQYPGLKPGSYVCLTVEDDGKGMDAETKNGIFEPFFTTKFQGRGMGMAAVYGMVRNHGGWIYVDSELGKGTKVRIYLPAIEIEVAKPKKAKAEVATGSGTILMIEDEEVVIEVTQAMLELLGYRVMVAKTGKDAIHIAETFDGQIDLALLDLKLPDIDGRNLYPLIMEARSNLKVIVFSGYSIDGPAREILDAGAQGFIQKPFSIATLSEKLKEVLEGE